MGSAPPDNTTTSNGSLATKLPEPALCSGIPNNIFKTLDSPLPCMVNAAINVPMAFVSISTNALVLLAMRRVTSIRLPSKLLLCSLALTDLVTASAVQPQYAAFLFSKAVYNARAPCALVRSLYFSSPLVVTASGYTLLLITLDRYAALFLHHKYQQIVTTRRVCAALAFTWSVSLCLASVALWNFTLFRLLNLTAIVLPALAVSVAQIRIYRRLRHLQSHGNNKAAQQVGVGIRIATYRKLASATLWIYVMLLLCYAPYLAVASFIQVFGYTPLSAFVRESTYTVLLLNSCLNPFIYCCRLRDVRNAVIGQLRELFCRTS